MSHILTLTTDFGNTFFVGIMKGVILSISQKITVVDIAHNIEKFNIEQGRFILSTSYHYFPENSVHVAVIDPGVGSSRKGIVVQTSKYYFVGPDNGIFSFIPKKDIVKIYQIIYKPSNVSSTFHGRDIFVPVAAKISLDNNCINEIGKIITCNNTYTFMEREEKTTRKVVYIDDFGNIILDLKKEEIEKMKNWGLLYKNLTFNKISKFYSEVKPEELLLLINSLGFVEIAMREGSAAKKLNAKIGDEYFIRNS
jgi:S-adenosylmethionine hydrolase